MTQHALNQQNNKLGNMFQLQPAIIRPKTERSSGTFNDYAIYGIPYSLQF